MSTPSDQPDQQPDQPSDQPKPQPHPLALERFELATAMRIAAEQLLGSDHGVTIFVHGTEPKSPCIAMQTTLPNRAAVRLVIAEVMFQSLISDGVTDPLDITAALQRDLSTWDQAADQVAP